MKVAFIANTSWNIYNFRIPLIIELLKQKHQIVVIAPWDEFTPNLIKLGCNCIDISLQNKGSNPFSDLKYLFRLFILFRNQKPDITLQYTIKCNIYGTLASAILNIPVINNVSGLGTVFLHHNLTSVVAKIMYRFAFRFPKLVFFQNEDDRNLFVAQGLVASDITDLLPGSGVDLIKFEPQPFQQVRPFRFVMASRLLFDKGVVEYAKAAAIIKKEYPAVEFHLVGAPDFDSGLGVSKEMLNSWVQNGDLIYHPFTANILDIIKDKSCVVLPSYREGTPKSLLEALALAKPIITTNVPGCKETVQQGLNGFLCTAKDEQSLAQALKKMLTLSTSELRDMSEVSRQIAVKKYDQNIVINKYINAIKVSLNIDDF